MTAKLARGGGVPHCTPPVLIGLKRCQLNLKILNLFNLESSNRIITKKSILYTVLRLSRVYTRRAFGDVAVD